MNPRIASTCIAALVAIGACDPVGIDDERATSSDSTGDPDAANESLVGCADLPSDITTDRLRGHLEALESIATPHGNRRSVGTIGYDLSVDYVREQLEDIGYTVTTHELDVEVAGEIRHTASVLAETPAGDPDAVVVLGAHLDSVPTGPGINDNGTGVAALIEVARAIHGCATTRRVRFAWWAAEEVARAGSTAYLHSLANDERDAITAYLNFDMIGSPNYVRFVYDGDGSASGAAGPAGSAEIEDAFASYFAQQHLPLSEVGLGGRSDYVAFLEDGIGVGGLFAGADNLKSDAEAQMHGGAAGVAYDACYHAQCDGVDNVDLEVLGSMTRAIAHAVEQLAM